MTTKLQPPEYSLDQAVKTLWLALSLCSRSFRFLLAFLFACATPLCTFEDDFLLYRLLFQSKTGFCARSSYHLFIIFVDLNQRLCRRPKLLARAFTFSS
jgi:hypothetical protein